MAQNFRTDSAVVGPIVNADDDMTGGDVFVILASVPGSTTLYALGYNATNTCYLLQGGLAVYLAGKTYASGTYTLPYFKYKKPVSNNSANYANGDNYYTIAAYTDSGATNPNFKGTLKLGSGSSIIVDPTDTDNVNTLLLASDDALTFPGLPSLLTGVGYYFYNADPNSINYVPSTDVLTTTDSADYAGLPGITPSATVSPIPTGTRFYMCSLKMFGTTACTNPNSSSPLKNLIYYQCPRTKSIGTTDDTGLTYYTKFCDTNAKTGLTSTTLCQLTNGTLPFYAYSNGVCGDKWPSDYSLTGMDGKSYTANSTYGMAYDGLCLANDKTSPTGYKSMSLQDAYTQLISEGDVKPPSGKTSTSTPWWMWLLLVLLIIGVIIMAVLLFMNMKKTETTTEVNSKGNVETVKKEEK